MTTIQRQETSEYNPSICIPRIEDGINETYIRNIFERLNLGILKSIKIQQCKLEKSERHVFINYYKWHDNEKSNVIRSRFKSEKPVNLMYSVPWFWKLKEVTVR